MNHPLRRLRLLIAYDGTEYCGWQRQKNAPSIQEEIEKRLHTMTGEDILLHGAGRTDAGVHAEGMVAHFDTISSISDINFLRGLNSMLPGSIRIFKTEICSKEFHARFSATGKRYHYRLFTGAILPPSERLYTLHITNLPEIAAIERSLHFLVGTHDFSSFENTGTRNKNLTTGRGAVRTITRARLLHIDSEHLTFEFIGDGFLKNMVRNLVGTLLEVGRKKINPEEFRDILLAKDRSSGGPTAPAHGLCMKEVMYG